MSSLNNMISNLSKVIQSPANLIQDDGGAGIKVWKIVFPEVTVTCKRIYRDMQKEGWGENTLNYQLIHSYSELNHNKIDSEFSRENEHLINYLARKYGRKF